LLICNDYKIEVKINFDINPKKSNNMSLVGKKAPVFNASAVINGNDIVENFSLDQFVGDKYVVFFFYPKDFTFVCPTEIIAFQNKIEEFEKRGVAVVGCSTDSEFSHWAWLNTEKNNGGIKGVKFPIVADISKTISMNYDVLAGEYDYNEDGEAVFNGAPVAYRGLFLIDKEGVVRHSLINDMPLGRSVDEALRMVDALKHFEEYGEVCPANWKEGDEAMNASSEGVASYLSKH
jgi:peroxiredoxin (alkyl hydroperoxide reductase subunit C)